MNEQCSNSLTVGVELGPNFSLKAEFWLTKSDLLALAEVNAVVKDILKLEMPRGVDSIPDIGSKLFWNVADILHKHLSQTSPRTLRLELTVKRPCVQLVINQSTERATS